MSKRRGSIVLWVVVGILFALATYAFAEPMPEPVGSVEDMELRSCADSNGEPVMIMKEFYASQIRYVGENGPFLLLNFKPDGERELIDAWTQVDGVGVYYPSLEALKAAFPGPCDILKASRS